jgi:pimeloyl-ACP methyl ester carboxylesterase
MEPLELEVKRALPDRILHEHPILFIHGAWHGAWAWEPHFMPFFRDRGYACYALSLRNHGNSPCVRSINRAGVADFLADIESTVQNVVRRDPILIAHSLGGILTQKYLERHPSPAAVLLASVPPTGVKWCLWRMFKRFPLAFLSSFLFADGYRIVDSPEKVRAFFLSKDTPDDLVAQVASQVGAESLRLSAEVFWTKIDPAFRRRTPLLVAGVEGDPLFFPDEVRATAKFYDAPCEIFPTKSHDVMLDADWQIAAESIYRWLERVEAKR